MNFLALKTERNRTKKKLMWAVVENKPKRVTRLKDHLQQVQYLIDSYHKPKTNRPQSTPRHRYKADKHEARAGEDWKRNI